MLPGHEHAQLQPKLSVLLSRVFLKLRHSSMQRATLQEKPARLTLSEASAASSNAVVCCNSDLLQQ